MSIRQKARMQLIQKGLDDYHYYIEDGVIVELMVDDDELEPM